jgi:high-affinity Fe2+/Pb2+ permease
MNKLIYNLLVTLLVLIILYSAFKKTSYTESFIPKIIKESYRPIERNIRKTYEGFYGKTSTDISNLFRKFGII